MERQLIIMRHAKSSWSSGVTSDHARPLNKRGRHDVPRVAARLAELGWMPEQILSSDSQRTRETCGLLCDTWGSKVSVDFLGQFYRAGTTAIRQEVTALSELVKSALVLGHNPGWSEAVWWLSGEYVHLTTANAVLLKSDSASWHDAMAQRGAWEQVEVIRPKELP